MLKAIVFDYNGTLVDDLDLHEESYYRSGVEMGFDITRDTVKKYISQSPSDKRVLFYGAISDAQWAQVIELKKKIYHQLAESSFRLFPQTEEALTRLSRVYRLAVLSNTFRFAFERFFPAHLARLFSTTLFFEEVDDPKPSPAPMRSVMGTLGLEKEECCYVGDAVEDIQMAKAAGVRAFSLTSGAVAAEELERAGADWVGPDLTALADRLLGGGSQKSLDRQGPIG